MGLDESQVFSSLIQALKNTALATVPGCSPGQAGSEKEIKDLKNFLRHFGECLWPGLCVFWENIMQGQKLVLPLINNLLVFSAFS